MPHRAAAEHMAPENKSPAGAGPVVRVAARPGSDFPGLIPSCVERRRPGQVAGRADGWVFRSFSEGGGSSLCR